jgi:hypothetical protein
MLPHIHFLLGLILVDCLGLNAFSSFLVILGSILPDLDWILGTVTKKNHRTFLSHYPMIWLLLAIFSFFMSLEVYWLFIAGFIHLLADVIDWEVYLLKPISDFKWSLFSLDPLVFIQDKTFKEQIILYYQQKKIICTELIIFGLFLFLYI